MKQKLVMALLLSVVAVGLAGCSKSTTGLTVETLSFEADTDIEEETIAEDFETESEEVVIPETEPQTEAQTEAAVQETEFAYTPTESVENYSIEEFSATMYTADDVNMRTAPGTGAELVSSFLKGDELTVTGKVLDANGAFTGWYQVSYDGGTNYVWGEPLKDSADSAAAAAEADSAAEEKVAFVFDASGNAVRVHCNGKNIWKDDKGVEYTFKDDVILDALGSVYKYVESESQVDVSGEKRLAYQNGYPTWLFKQGDGTWVNGANIQFTEESDSVMSVDGTEYTYLTF